MTVSRRRVLCYLAAGAAGTGPVFAQAPARTFEESYRTIAPRPAPAGDTIEVIDFFWYGCPYCYTLLPLLMAWEKSKPADVVLRHVPAILRREWLPDAHRYYTLEKLGEVERLHARVFEAINRDRLLSGDTEGWARWAVANGIERARWDAAHAAQDVRDKVVGAADLGRDYDVRATPVMVVDGRYQTGSGQSGSVQNVMPTVDGLIKLARERRKKA